MKDFWIDKNGNFIMNGRDIQFTPDDVSYVVQRLQIKMRTFYGEYFLNNTMGIPYFPNPKIPGYISVFGKNPNINTINALFKKVLVSESLVDKITSFLTSYDDQIRQYQIDFIVLLKTGASINSSILVP